MSRVSAACLQELAELGHRLHPMALTREKPETELRKSEETLAATLHSVGMAPSTALPTAPPLFARSRGTWLGL